MEYKYWEYKNVKIAYKEEGKGYPVFMIPPWTSGSRVYGRLAELFDKDMYKIIRIDLPGWGGSVSDQIPEDVSFYAYLEMISEFVNSFGYKEYSMLGYSIGVAFILQGISRKMFSPDKVVVVSGFQQRSDIFDSALNKNLRYYPIIKKLKFLFGLFKKVMEGIYSAEVEKGELYKEEEMRQLFTDIISENLKCDISSVMEPVYTLGDIDIEAVKENINEVIVVYNINEPIYYQESNKEIAEQFGVKPFVVDAFDHRHLSFEPEKSFEYIDNFLKK
jgi:hypothetical protein